jgi:hypothetical protein
MSLISTNLILSLANTQMYSINIPNNFELNSSTKINNGKQLAETASEQKPVNYHLCLFQYQLIRILYLIIKYSMKSARPLSFFDTKVSKFKLIWLIHMYQKTETVFSF